LARQQHLQPPRRWRGERGAVALTNGIVIAVVVVAALVSASLLARTARAANRINHKAEHIATGQGINTATDSVPAQPHQRDSQFHPRQRQVDRLGRAVDLGGTAVDGGGRPVDGLAGAVDRAGRAVDGPKAISGHASSINGSATAINATAGAINAQAAAILDVAKRINNDVAQINTNLDGTLAVANIIKTDTGNILVEAKAAERYAKCIDERIPPPGPPCA
jgi:hypothetical protein